MEIVYQPATKRHYQKKLKRALWRWQSVSDESVETSTAKPSDVLSYDSKTNTLKLKNIKDISHLSRWFIDAEKWLNAVKYPSNTQFISKGFIKSPEEIQKLLPHNEI